MRPGERRDPVPDEIDERADVARTLAESCTIAGTRENRFLTRWLTSRSATSARSAAFWVWLNSSRSEMSVATPSHSTEPFGCGVGRAETLNRRGSSSISQTTLMLNRSSVSTARFSAASSRGWSSGWTMAYQRDGSASTASRVSPVSGSIEAETQ